VAIWVPTLSPSGLLVAVEACGRPLRPRAARGVGDARVTAQILRRERINHRARAPVCAGQQGRPEAPVAGDETATLLGSLERQRATLACESAWRLDAAGLRARAAASSITLGVLPKHLA